MIAFERQVEYRNKTFDPMFKGVVLDFMMAIRIANDKNYKKFTFKTCPEDLMPLQSVYYMRKNFYLLDILNERMENFKSSGLINYFISKNLNLRPSRSKKSKSDPTSITFHHLRGIFEMLIYGLAFSFLVLFFEVLKNCVNNKSKF